EPRHRGVSGRLRLARLLLADAAASAPAEWRHAFTETRLSRATKRHPSLADRMDALWQDLRYAARSLRRAPAFVAVVVISLALGIGANTLVYSMLDGLVLHPFAYPDPDRFVAVGAQFPKVSGERAFIETLSPPEYTDIRDGAPSLEHVAAIDLGNRSISGGDHPERVFTAFVWGDPLASMGVTAAIGRAFRQEETTTPGHAVVLLSHRIWQSRFGGDSSLVGRAMRVNGEPYTVVGIMPPNALLLGADMWMPMGTEPQNIPRRARQWAVVGRLKQGATIATLNSELARVSRRTEQSFKAEHDVYEGWNLQAAPWAEALTTTTGIRMAAFILQGAVLLVLLIACVNVAGLLLSRGAARDGEIAMRRALGAGTGRLTRQLLTEGVMLSLVGGAAGLAVAMTFMGPLSAALPGMVRSMGLEARPNGRVLIVTLLASVGVGLAFGLAPMLQGAWHRTGVLFGQLGPRTTQGRSARRIRAGFLAVQVALSVILLVAAGLLTRSMTELRRVELGFDPERVLTMRVSVAREKYADSTIVPFVERIAERLAGIPGVRATAATTQYAPGNVFASTLSLRGETPGQASARQVDVTNATPDIFPTLGYQLRTGRLLASTDREGMPLVAVVNETLARRYFPNASPVGQQVWLGDSTGAQVEVVGVVADVRNRGLDAPVAAEVFMSARQQRVQRNNQFFLLVRTQGDPMATLPAVRRAIQELDSDQPVYNISTIERDLGESLVQRSAAMTFLLVFSGIALVLASVGIYGLVSYSVAERGREIGIRMALGAEPQDVRQLVLRQTAIVLTIGCAIGVAGALALSGTVRSLVYGVSPSDPLTIVGVVVVLFVVGAIAGAIPTRRATRIQPVSALREG
ncbi:MAG: ABC transporter permease, partial [Cytophagaceae bacterium]|nr:ABC transporter permease [Gemmatimonadaceae bacterium]